MLLHGAPEMSVGAQWLHARRTSGTLRGFEDASVFAGLCTVFRNKLYGVSPAFVIAQPAARRVNRLPSW